MWTTEVKLPTNLPKLDHRDSVVLMGSCFSTEIGGKLKSALFNVNINENGTIFHPVPLCRSICRAISGVPYHENDLIFAQGKWHSIDHQGHVSHEDKSEALRQMNTCSSNLHQALKKAKVLVLTLGTSWGYMHKANGVLVANCHRIPQAEFSKVLTQKEELIDLLSGAFKVLHKFNPSLEIIQTVSPVRHWKDGAIENSNSKSELICAVHEAVRQSPQVHYFPAYEIMMDELRDYRFYKDDMLHPSSLAVDFIWQKFQASTMTRRLQSLNEELSKLARLFKHKDTSEEHMLQVESVKKEMEKKVSEFYGTKKG
jgi:hypothetical protein